MFVDTCKSYFQHRKLLATYFKFFNFSQRLAAKIGLKNHSNRYVGWQFFQSIF